MAGLYGINLGKDNKKWFWTGSVPVRKVTDDNSLSFIRIISSDRKYSSL